MLGCCVVGFRLPGYKACDEPYEPTKVASLQPYEEHMQRGCSIPHGASTVTYTLKLVVNGHRAQHSWEGAL